MSEAQTDLLPPPRHVAIIMDGNGRWAKARGLSRNQGHKAGSENLRDVLKAAKEANLEYLTVYAFSAENWRRPKAEISSLMSLLNNFLDQHIKELEKQQIRLRLIGRWQELQKPIVRKIEKAMERTAHFSKHTLVLALNYGARSEMLDAMKRASVEEKNLETIDWETFSKYLYTSDIPDPDLLIRTSGEMRISNFLLMQCAYSELYFTPVLWPDFGHDELLKAIDDYRRRQRRYGMTGEQIIASSV